MGVTASWSFPTRVLFGPGAVSEAGRELGALGVTRALCVTDRGVSGAGLLQALERALADADVGLEVFDGVAGNPLEAQVHAGHDAYVAANADGLVAVGGGSSIDVAKIIALTVSHRRPLEDYDDAKGGERLITEPIPPIVAIPTTAGTGSEVGRSGVVTLASTGRKTVIFSPKLMPSVAILDPEMTQSMPAAVTAATGFDALTHCIEAYVSKGDHPMCDSIALGGIRLVARALERAVAEGGDLGARGDMMKAAMMGAVAFQKGLGVCHSLAHPLSSVCGLHHGLANALCLPAVVRFNMPVVRERYADVARLLIAAPDADRCADAIAELRTRVGLPGGLEAAGVMRDQLERLADEAIADACHTLNPRGCTREDMLALYHASL
jgi:alcohol dehydrogenase class IV